MAVTIVLMPPRTEKSPTTVMPSRLARGDKIVEDLVGHRLVEDAAIAEPDDVVLQRFQLDAAIAGTYVMRISPKSGRPVFGQTEVNSGQLIAISNSRSGRGFGKCLERCRGLTSSKNSSTLGRNRSICVGLR